MNLFAINVGSTRTRIGSFVDGALSHSESVVNADMAAMEAALKQTYAPLEQGETVTIVASVNPPIAEAVTKLLTAMAVDVKRVERDVTIPIGRQLDREAIVGEDRLLNAAAAYDVLKQACIVVDAGTAITIDLVDGEGTFHGGVIAPGAGLMLASLHEHTASLPLVKPGPPTEPVGHNTVEAMKAGVYHALRGMLRETVERYAEVIGTFVPVIATGGDAQWLFADHELIDRIVPDLTLQGIQLCLQTALNAEE